MARRFPICQVDVFASTPLEGNPLAVFTDGRGLSDNEMQALARETNLSETTFILPRDHTVERERGVQVRIFTVREELPFAGHPTLGTASVIQALTGASLITLDLKVGQVPVRFEETVEGSVFGEMTQVEPRFGQQHDPVEVAKSRLDLPLDALDGSLPIETVSTGVPFAVVPLRSLETARALAVDAARVEPYLAAHGARHFYFVTRETVSQAARLHARMFFYGGEDPATGSAAGCCAAWATKHGVAQPDERILIEQGLERTASIAPLCARRSRRRPDRQCACGGPLRGGDAWRGLSVALQRRARVGLALTREPE